MNEIYYNTERGRLYKGDCLEVIPAEFPDIYFDSVITDPPYALTSKGQAKGGFMGQAWDKVLPAKEIWIECLRVAKPGAMMLVFGGDRTHHRLMVDIEDAGWEIRTCVYWLFGSGFPKSANISKQIDKMKGVESIDLGKSPNWRESKRNREQYGSMEVRGKNAGRITAPATPEAQRWDGWGTGLKPAVEIIVLAMKPLDGTFAENVLKWGVGGLNIDGSRIEGAKGDGVWGTNQVTCQGTFNDSPDNKQYKTEQHPQGRWPANLILSHLPECRQVGVKKVKGIKGGWQGSGERKGWGMKAREQITDIDYADPDGTETVPAWECVEGCPVQMLDLQSGELTTGAMLKPYEYTNTGHSMGKPAGHTRQIHEASRGGASRFFYTAKASRSEREQGLKGHIPCVKCGGLDTDYHLNEKGKKVKCVRNDHPTVKSLAIMEYLCKLTMTPDGGIVLDPFAGTGTTLKACEKLGRNWVGIEQEEKNCQIAKYRIEGIEGGLF